MTARKRGLPRRHAERSAPQVEQPCPVEILDIAGALGVMLARIDHGVEQSEKASARGDLCTVQF